MEDLAQFGATVHTCARNETELDQRLQEWRDLGYKVTGAVCDVSVRAAREKLMEEVTSLFHGKLNILVSFVFHSSVEIHDKNSSNKSMLKDTL